MPVTTMDLALVTTPACSLEGTADIEAALSDASDATYVQCAANDGSLNYLFTAPSGQRFAGMTATLRTNVTSSGTRLIYVNGVYVGTAPNGYGEVVIDLDDAFPGAWGIAGIRIAIPPGMSVVELADGAIYTLYNPSLSVALQDDSDPLNPVLRVTASATIEAWQSADIAYSTLAVSCRGVSGVIALAYTDGMAPSEGYVDITVPCVAGEGTVDLIVLGLLWRSNTVTDTLSYAVPGPALDVTTPDVSDPTPDFVVDITLAGSTMAGTIEFALFEHAFADQAGFDAALATSIRRSSLAFALVAGTDTVTDTDATAVLANAVAYSLFVRLLSGAIVGDWDRTDFTTAFSTCAAPSMSLTQDTVDGRLCNIVHATPATASGQSDPHVEVQRSIDSRPFVRVSYVAGTFAAEQDWTDTATMRGLPIDYRARVWSTLAGLLVSGPWSTASATPVSGTPDWALSAPGSDADSVSDAVVTVDPQVKTSEGVAIVHTLDADDPLALGDGKLTTDFPLDAVCLTSGVADDLDALLALKAPLLLDGGDGSRWIRVTSWTRLAHPSGPWTYNLSCTQVREPVST
jgi:hypothetical protein